MVFECVRLTGDWKITEQIYDIMVETDFLPVNYEIMPLFSDKISVDEKAADKAAQANKSEHYLVSLSQKIKKLEKRVSASFIYLCAKQWVIGDRIYWQTQEA